MIVAICALAVASAGTITVTSPSKGTAADPTLVGNSTTISFSLRNMGQSEARISVVVRRVSDNSIFSQTQDAARVTPSTSNDDGSGSYTLSFLQGTPEVVYKVEIRATPTQAGATTYNTDQDLFVKPDLTKPKFLSFNPINNTFVKGIVPIRVRIAEANLKDWRVQINNQDIPNNQGSTVSSTGEFTVNWNTSGIQFDGPQTISVRVRDNANNEENLSITVTLDRVKPIITIQSPQNNARFSPGTSITVVADIRDFSNSSVNVNGIDIVVRTTSGVFITRAARQSNSNLDANTLRWVGRIRWVNGQLPKTFKIEVTARDRAGNDAVKQTVTVNIG